MSIPRPVPAPNQTEATTRACAQEKCQGMARSARGIGSVVRRAGREPIASRSMASMGVKARWKTAMPGSAYHS